MRKAHLFNQENKMRLINQQLYKRRKIAFKKLRIQQQQQQPPITINVNTGFETNRRIKEIYNKLELLTPQEVSPSREEIYRRLGIPPPPDAPTPPQEKVKPPQEPRVKPPTEQKIYNPTTNRYILKEGAQGTELEKRWVRGEFKDKDGKVLKLKDDKFLMDKNTDKKELKIFGKALKQKYF